MRGAVAEIVPAAPVVHFGARFNFKTLAPAFNGGTSVSHLHTGTESALEANSASAIRRIALKLGQGMP